MIVVAGPPGSGKTSSFPVTTFGVDAFNIDDRCAQILGSYRAIPRDVRRAVAKECERFVLDQIEAGRSFAVETKLRTGAAVTQAPLAHSRGFATEMVFVATDSVDENLDRILQRAQGGGHGASEREVRAIHEASLSNLNDVRRVRARGRLRLDGAMVAAATRRNITTRPGRSSPSHSELARRGTVHAQRLTLPARCPLCTARPRNPR